MKIANRLRKRIAVRTSGPILRAQVVEPSGSQCHGHRHTNQKQQKQPDDKLEDKLPEEESDTSAIPSSPCLANRTVPAQNEIEENETEDAVEVNEDESHHHGGGDCSRMIPMIGPMCWEIYRRIEGRPTCGQT